MATKLQWSLPADGLCNGALAIIVVALVVASREDSHEGLIVHHVEPSELASQCGATPVADANPPLLQLWKTSSVEMSQHANEPYITRRHYLRAAPRPHFFDLDHRSKTLSR